MRLRIAGAQIPVTKDIDMNLSAILRAVEFSISEGADILLTPEGSLSGYTHIFDDRKVRSALAVLLEKCASNQLGLALGTCFIEDDGLCYNQIRFYDKKGNFLGFHTKTLKCGNYEDPPRGEIENYSNKPLRTFDFEGIKIGGLICNDLWANPGCTPLPDTHLTQMLSRMGARVIFHSVNGGGRDEKKVSVLSRYFHEFNLIKRAIAGNIWIASVDNCFPENVRTSSRSGIINPEGKWVVKARPSGEDYFVRTINLE